MKFEDAEELMVDVLTEYLPKNTLNKESKHDLAILLLAALEDEGVLDVEDPPEDEDSLRTLEEVINGD